MRGAVSGGMALALDELGLAGAFDAAYGSSAGTLNAMWLVSGRVRDGIPTWTDPQLVAALISRRRAVLRRGPVVDVRGLVEERYEQLSPGLFAAVLAATTELHPLATDVATGAAVDLHGAIADEPIAAPRPARLGRAALPRRRAGRARRPPLRRRRPLRRDPVPRGARRRRDPRARAALADRRARRSARRAARAPRSPARCSAGWARSSRPPSAPAWSASWPTRRCWPSTTPTRRASRRSSPSARPPGSPVPGRLERDVGDRPRRARGRPRRRPRRARDLTCRPP